MKLPDLHRAAGGLNLHNVSRLFVYGTLIGGVAGAGAIVFNLLCQGVSHFLLDAIAGWRPAGPASEIPLLAATRATFRPWLIPMVAALGGLASGILVQRFAPEAAGHGTDAAIDSFHRKRGVVRGRVPLVKTLASALTIGSGGSGGREGPIAQIGAGFGSVLATRLGLPDRDRRILLAAGVGAGVGSIFRAPLAGALFAAEILYSEPDFEADVVIPAAISTIVAYCVFSFYFGFGALFHAPDFRFVSVLELAPYTVLALVSALGAGLFVEVFYWTHHRFDQLPLPARFRPALGALLAGGVGVSLYFLLGTRQVLDVLSFGYGSLEKAMAGQLALTTLLALALGKILTTSLSIGSGGSGGVFGPSMVIGGSLGGIVGILAQKLLPGIPVHPGAYVVVGMAGFFAAAAKTPISTLVMVSEMTGSYMLLLPSLWVCSLAFLLARHWRLYRNQVPTRFDSPAHRGDLYVDVLQELRVSDLPWVADPVTLRETDCLDEMLRALAHSTQSVFPILDGEGNLAGTLLAADLRGLLEERDLGMPVIARDLAYRPAQAFRPSDSLDAVLQHFVTFDVEEVPVVDGGDGVQLLGLVTRHELIRTYNQRRLALRAAPAA